MDNEKLLLRCILDIREMAERYNTPRFSGFLDETERAAVKANRLDFGALWYGGYEGASRNMIGFFPDWAEPDLAEFPISAVKFTNKSDRKLSHREYLGTIMSLGIDRRKIGDIAVSDDGACVFASSDIAGYIAAIDKISRCGVKAEIIPLSECEVAEPEFELLDIVAASMRLDAVVAAVLKLSRKNAADLITSGRCFVNHFEILRTDYGLNEGDLLSLRGFGRVEIVGAEGETRSGRLHIKIKKFI